MLSEVSTFYMNHKKLTLEEEFNVLIDGKKTILNCREPAMIYLNMCAFNTVVKSLDRPYDGIFYDAMRNALTSLCNNLHGCIFGYTASNAIAVILATKPNATPWVGYNAQKMSSIAASIATVAFNNRFKELCSVLDDKDKEQYTALLNKPMYFDAVSVNVPANRAADMIYWLQRDRNRHAVQELGRCYYNRRELLGLSNGEIIAKLANEQEVDFHSMPTMFKRGIACYKVPKEPAGTAWAIDENLPFYDNTESKRFLNEQLDSFVEMYSYY